ncbi:AMP-binding protein [Planctomycetaceae bacterium SH139]
MDSPQTPAEYLLKHAQQSPSAVAWIEPGVGTATWLEIAVVAAELAEQLAATGVRPGERVVTQLPNGWSAVVMALAVQLCGATESPLDDRLPPSRVATVVARLETRFVLSSAELHAQHLSPFAGLQIESVLRSATGASAVTKLESLLRSAQQLDAVTELGRRTADQPALILWTSGTTAEPKGVVLTATALVKNALGKLAAAPQTPQDRRLSVLPFAHAYSRTCDLMTWLISGGQLAAGSGWQAIEQLGPAVRPTLLNCVPYLIDKIFAASEAHSEADPESETQRDRQLKAQRVGDQRRLRALGLEQLRMLGCGGAALETRRFQQIRQLGIAPIQGYGLTEAGPVICSATPDDCRPGVVGRPLPETEVRINRGGEIEARGPGLMREYWRDPEATRRRFTADGWLRTGDAGRLGADGMLQVLGRSDDVLVLSTGRKVFPLTWEAKLRRTPGVRHVVLAARGSRIVAGVDPGADWSEEVFRRAYESLRSCDAELPPLAAIQLAGIELAAGPWSFAAGQLTVKGTVRRHMIASG